MTRKKTKATAAGATVKRVVTVTENPKDEYADIDPFARVKSDFGDSVDAGRVKMTILRVAPSGVEYLESVDYVEDIHTPEWIRDTHGPGKYVLRFLDRDSRETWSKRFSIARLSSDSVDAAPVVVGPSTSEIELMKILREQNNAMFGSLLGAKGTQADMSPIVAMMDQQTKLTQTLLTALLNRPDSTAVLLSGAEKIIELVSEARDSSSSGDLMSMLPKLAKEIRPVLEAASARPSAPANADRAPPGTLAPGAPVEVEAPGFTRMGAGNTPAKVVHSDVTPSGGSIDEMLQAFAPQFLELIEKGFTSEAGATAVLDSVPRVFHEQLTDIDADKIIQIEPRLAHHRQWVEDMVGFIREDE